MSTTEQHGTLTQPFRVVILGSDIRPRKMYVVVGRVPSAVANALRGYKIMSAGARKLADKTLSAAYGDQYRSILALDAAAADSVAGLSKYAPPTISPNEVIHGGHSRRAFGHVDNPRDDNLHDTAETTHPADEPPNDSLLSAWYDPEDYEGMMRVGGTTRIDDDTISPFVSPPEDTPVSISNRSTIVDVSDISDSLSHYSDKWFAEHKDCIAGADLTAPISVAQVGPDLVPRGKESICAVRRAMEIGVKTLPAVIRTTTPKLTSRSIKYNYESASAGVDAPKYPALRTVRHVVDYNPAETSAQPYHARSDPSADGNRVGGMLEDEEIEALLNEEAPVQETVNITYSTGILPPKTYSDQFVEYVMTVSVYQVDKITELSEKIQLVSEIPLYRQHMCWVEGGVLKTAYMVSANGTIETDIRAIQTHRSSRDTAAAKATVIGIPINRTLYNKRDIVRIETHDAFKLVGSINTAYVLDLAEWMAPVRSQLQEILKDSYQMDLLYWGFVALYWPRLTRECFHVYASAESSIPQMYPDLMPSRSILKQRASEEQLWFEHVRATSARIEAFSRGHITTAVITAVVSIKNAKVVLNLRNVIEFMNTTPEMPEIRAHILDHPRKYIIRRTHASYTDISWPSGAIYRSGITFVIKPIDRNVLFVNIGTDGTLHVKISAPEEDAISFDEIYKLVITYANPIIAHINKMGRYVFMSGMALAPGTKTNMIFGSLNMCLYWKRVMSSGSFNVLKSSFDRLMRAGITQPRAIQQADKHELLFCKAMHWFDPSTIDRIMIVVGGGQPLMNQYAYMSVANVKQKWDNAYSGRIIRISHRTTDVRFEIIDVREDEFRMLSEHLATLLYDVAAELRTNPAAPSRSQRRLRKLREEDPDLFNLKKYGSKKVYSILCQNTRQPVIFTPDEVAAMDPNGKKKLVKYINFTKNAPAYYACPSTMYPHLGYLVGAHPKGFCLPCCNKRVQTGRKADIYEKCSTCGKWSGESPGDSSRHIMSYSKQTDLGRLSKLPTSIHAVLNPTGSGTQRGRKKASADNISGVNTSHARGYYILGVEQTLPGIPDAGFAHACARALGMTVGKMFQHIVSRINNSDLFMTCRQGQLTSVWDTARDLADTLTDLFVLLKPWTKYAPPFWDTTVFSLVADVFEVGVIYWHDSVVKTAFESIMPVSTRNPAAYIMIIRRSEYYVPVVQITHADYSRNGHIGEHNDDRSSGHNERTSTHTPGQYGGPSGGLFSADGPAGSTISKMVSWARSDANHGLQWISAKLGQPTEVFIDRHGSSHAAVWQGVYITIPGDTPIGLPGGIIRRESYKGPPAPAADGILVLKTLLGDDLNHAIVTLATDCAHVRVGDIGVIVSGYAPGGIPGDTVDDGMKTCGIAMLDVMRVMHDNTPPVEDPSTKGLGRAFYETHQYTLFLVEFVNLLAGERNKVIRGKLAAEIDRIALPRGIGQLKRSIRTILAEWGDDFSLIMSMIAAASMTGSITRAVLHQIIDGEVYEFDNITLSTMKSMDDAALTELLTEMARKFVVEVDKLPDNIEFPNVFESCAIPRPDGQTVGYCDKRKLMINVPLAGLIDILAADLKNPIKSKYLLNGTWLETTLDWFDFQRNSDERVIVYRV